MLRTDVALEGVSVVFVGSFNPAIFHPQWFARQNVTLSDLEADAARNVITTPDFSTFATEQFNVQVTVDKFQVQTSFAPTYELLRDLAVGTFRVLRHTPIKMLGINRDVHFETKPEDLWHAIGHQLAPKDIWTPILKQPGTRSLTIEGTRPDGHRGAIRVKVEPSALVQPGVFLGLNDHFEVEEADGKAGQLGTQLVDTLEAEWERSYQRSTAIIEHISEVLWSLRTKTD